MQTSNIDLSLIQVRDNHVSARNLYKFLELNPKSFARWSKKNILSNELVEQNKDFTRGLHNAEGQEFEDYFLTIDFAKELCMMARTRRGKQAREYFIECEHQLRIATTENTLALPQNYKEALKALIEAEEMKEALQFENESQKARMLKQEQDSNDTKIMLLDAKAGQFKTNAQAIKNDIGAEINNYVKTIYLEEAEGRYNIAHTMAQDDYTRVTGYYYPGAKTASLDTKKHYLNWLRSEKAKVLEAKRGITTVD